MKRAKRTTKRAAKATKAKSTTGNGAARNARTPADFVARIKKAYEGLTGAWKKTVPQIVAVGRLLNEAEDELGKDSRDWKLVTNRLPFGERTRQMLQRIGRNSVVGDPKFVAAMPMSWAALDQLAGIKPEELIRLVGLGKEGSGVHVDMTVEQARQLRQHADGKTANGEEHGPSPAELANWLRKGLRMFAAFPRPSVDLRGRTDAVAWTGLAGKRKEIRELADWFSKEIDALLKELDKVDAAVFKEQRNVARRVAGQAQPPEKPEQQEGPNQPEAPL